VSLARRAVLGGLRLYKRFVSPMLPVACRFEPTCSEYAMAAVSRHGIARGLWLAAKRILRCRPGGGGGADPVPP
jgi:putative membrane protein insertion efficiency factor